MLTGEELRLSFGGIQALSGVSFELMKGEILAVIGPNGSGKTSLINCVSGFYRPQQGRLFFDATEITRLAPHKIAKLGIGRAFQNMALYGEMTTLDNLMVARYMHTRAGMLESVLPFGRASREEMESRLVVEEVISFAGLQELRKKTVASLPFGQRKLIDIARALATQPKLVLLDEPTSGLDTEMKRRVARMILDLRERRGVAVLVVEHDMRIVMDLADRIITLNHGEKIAEGTPKETRDDPRVIEAYLGERSLREDKL